MHGDFPICIHILNNPWLMFHHLLSISQEINVICSLTGVINDRRTVYIVFITWKYFVSDVASWEMGRAGIFVFVVFSLDRFPFIYKFSFVMLESLNHIFVSFSLVWDLELGFICMCSFMRTATPSVSLSLICTVCWPWLNINTCETQP